MSPTWDILIASVCSRAGKLARLLEHLSEQMLPGVRVLVCQDNAEMEIGEKVQLLVSSSDAEYVSMIGDDDWVTGFYVRAVVDALGYKPDYVSFLGRHLGQLVSYSMNPKHWRGAAYTSELPGTLTPTRREIVTLVPFSGGIGEDRRWAVEIKARGAIRTEAFIDAELYEYRWDPNDSIQTGTIARVAKLPEQPSYPSVVWIPPVIS